MASRVLAAPSENPSHDALTVVPETVSEERFSEAGNWHGLPSGGGEALQRALQAAWRLARVASFPILIEGESGTGKTLLARRIHESSPRRPGPFTHVVLSALDDTLASSELFGHARGAYTDAKTARAGCFVSAHGGTLFLDEVGKASTLLQRRLLHSIETGEVKPLGADRTITVDVRIIAASNVTLSELVEDELFLSDLYARLEPGRVVLPPLRDRRSDIPRLVEYYVRREAAAHGYAQEAPSIDESLLDRLRDASWPFNLRQLHGVIRRLLVEADGAPVLRLSHCPGELDYLWRPSKTADGGLGAIRDALRLEGNNVTRAAARLGIDRTTLYRRLRRLDGGQSPGAVRGTATGLPRSATG